ncbi:MAG: pilus assembly PilX family protein, partial [Desulfobulbales bacterium]
MKTLHREEGFVLVTALLVMLVLTIIGIAATTNTSIELQIAANDKVHKKTFYEAEGGASLGTEVLEQAFGCPVGFTATGTTTDSEGNVINIAELEGTVRVYDRGNDLTLWRNPAPPPHPDPGYYSCTDAPDDADAAYPIAKLASGIEVGYIQMGGETHMLPGGALQMAAGYEGKGKSAAQGGVAKIFDIYS